MDRNTRHSVDKGKDFIKSGMTLITDIESEKYLRNAKHKNLKDEDKRQKDS